MLKKCLICNKKFEVKPSIFKIRKCCSLKCKYIFTKGKHPSPATEFKKGTIPPNKGTHIQSNTGRTHFKKGQRGNKAGHWKGGKYKDFWGYILIWKPKHPFCNNDGYVRKSRLTIEKKIGRFLKPKEVVHHINKNTSDNSPKNLKLFVNHSEHQKFHHPKGKKFGK